MSSPASLNKDIEANAQATIGDKNVTLSPQTLSPPKLGNPAPLGLLAFAQALFLISIFGVGAGGVASANLLIASLIFFGGTGQFIAGVFEFVGGNTFGATVFCSYSGFQLSYALIYLPGSGIIAAYTDAATGLPSAEFYQALALFIWAWFILSVIFTVAAIRTTWILFLVLVFTDLTLLCLAASYESGVAGLATASCAFGFCTAFLAYWAGASALFHGLTPFSVPVFPMVKQA